MTKEEHDILSTAVETLSVAQADAHMAVESAVQRQDEDGRKAAWTVHHRIGHALTLLMQLEVT